MRGFRWPALVLIPSLAVGAAVYDDQRRPEVTQSAPQAAAGLAVINVGDEPSTWFCAAASVGDADIVTVTNPTADARSGTITMIPATVESGADAAETVALPIEIPARGEVTVRPTDSTDASVVSAVVELDGGGVMVEHVNTFAENGSTDRRPCATEAGSASYLPAGTTVADAAVFLVVFNPFPDDAVLDVTFDTELGGRNPDAYEGLVVPGGSSRLLNIESEVPERERLATFIETRSGRVVVDRVLEFDGTAGRTGLSVATGLSAPQTVAYLPVGKLGPGETSSIIVMNPSHDEAAEVDISIIVSAERAVEPLERRVFPRTAAVIDLSSEALAATLDGVDQLSVVVTSTNGVPIAVERLSLSQGEGGAGLATTIASPRAARVWLTDVSIADPSRSSIVLLNPSFDTLVQVAVYRPGNDEPVASIELRRGGRAVVELATLGEAGTFELVASSPIVVERDLVGVSSRSTALGLPVLEP